MIPIARSRARPMPSAVMEAVPVAVGIGQDLVGGVAIQLGELAGNFEVALLQLGFDRIGAGRLATLEAEQGAEYEHQSSHRPSRHRPPSLPVTPRPMPCGASNPGRRPAPD